jgi:F420-0:gamma-glutamyl ligase
MYFYIQTRKQQKESELKIVRQQNKKSFTSKESTIITTPSSSTQRLTSGVERYNSLEPTAVVTPLSTRNLNSPTRRSMPQHLATDDTVESVKSKRKLPTEFGETQLECMYIISSSVIIFIS